MIFVVPASLRLPSTFSFRERKTMHSDDDIAIWAAISFRAHVAPITSGSTPCFLVTIAMFAERFRIAAR